MSKVLVEEGIKRFGNKAIEAVLKEYTQLNDKQVFRPRFVNELTSKQKSEVLNLITIVKQKNAVEPSREGHVPTVGNRGGTSPRSTRHRQQCT